MLLWFDDLEVGRAWHSPSRTVTEADVDAFAELTGDRFPLHTDEKYAARSPFGTRIAHGLLGLTFSHGLMWAHTGEFDESIIAFLGIREWRFLGPLHFGDAIRVRYEVAALRPSSTEPDRGVAEFDVRVFDQRDTVIQQGVQTLLMRNRPA